jgi:hypothetical protein
MREAEVGGIQDNVMFTPLFCVNGTASDPRGVSYIGVDRIVIFAPKLAKVGTEVPNKLVAET